VPAWGRGSSRLPRPGGVRRDARGAALHGWLDGGAGDKVRGGPLARTEPYPALVVNGAPSPWGRVWGVPCERGGGS